MELLNHLRSHHAARLVLRFISGCRGTAVIGRRSLRFATTDLLQRQFRFLQFRRVERTLMFFMERMMGSHSGRLIATTIPSETGESGDTHDWRRTVAEVWVQRVGGGRVQVQVQMTLQNRKDTLPSQFQLPGIRTRDLIPYPDRIVLRIGRNLRSLQWTRYLFCDLLQQKGKAQERLNTCLRVSTEYKGDKGCARTRKLLNGFLDHVVIDPS